MFLVPRSVSDDRNSVAEVTAVRFPPWSRASTSNRSAAGWATTSTGSIAPFTFERIGGGRSNLTFAVSDGSGTRFVLRRPPLHHVLATAHDMTREFRAISAIGPTAVPVPEALGLCTDESVNGTPFYVMSLVDGAVVDSVDGGAGHLPQCPGGDDDPARRHPRRAARSRRRCHRPRRLRPTRRLHRSPDRPVVQAVGAVQDTRSPGRRRRRQADSPIACPCSKASPWCTATIGSATASSTRRPARLPPSSIGSCARSATRLPTSATSAPTGRRGRVVPVATTTRRVLAGSARSTTSSGATPSTALVTWPRSTSTWRSSCGARRSSSRACTPAISAGPTATSSSAPSWRAA